jgi:hypothetical protein
MELPEPELVAVETAPESEHAPDETEMTMAASANGAANPSAAPLFDDLDVPAILRRDRRFVQ